MEWVGELANSLQAIAQSFGPFEWLIKLAGLIAFILLMVMVVALLYSGEVQNSEKGPLSFVGKSSLNDDAFQCIDPIITNNLDTKRAVCTFYISYVDRRQRPRRKRIHRARLEFKKLNRSPQRDIGSTLVGFWNPPRHEELVNALQTVGIVPDAPNLFAEDVAPPTEEAPGNVPTYYLREVTETKTVALSNKTLAALGAAQSKFLKDELAKIERIPRNKAGVRSLEGKSAYLDMPNLSEDAHYFVEMKFAINPLFVLTEHPDGQVKTTAWLTVLTSFFAIFMQVIYNGFG